MVVFLSFLICPILFATTLEFVSTFILVAAAIRYDRYDLNDNNNNNKNMSKGISSILVASFSPCSFRSSFTPFNLYCYCLFFTSCCFFPSDFFYVLASSFSRISRSRISIFGRSRGNGFFFGGRALCYQDDRILLYESSSQTL